VHRDDAPIANGDGELNEEEFTVFDRDVPGVSPDAVVPLARFRERISWALYDFANTIFSMNIATLYFAAWLVKDLQRSNTLFATANGIGAALVVVSVPILGAYSDATQRRKPWVVGFTLFACAATLAMAALGEHAVPLVGESVRGGGASAVMIKPLALFALLAAFVAANYAYQAAQPFYNAMMAELAPPGKRGRLSGMGSALAYAGSITGLVLTLPFFTGGIPLIGTIRPSVMERLRSIVPLTAPGGRVSTFAPTVFLFLLFSIPLALFCRDHHAVREKVRIPWRKSFESMRQTLREAKRYPGVGRFILTSFLYQDAMGTIITNMALYAIFAMGFKEGSEVTLFVILTVPAVLGSYLIGKIVDRIGPKKSLMYVIAGWVVLLAGMILAPSRAAFWIVGAMIGLIYGGVSTAERPLLLSLVPDVEAGRFFSLMVLSARAAAIVGPFIWAVTVDNLIAPLGTPAAYRAGVVTVMIGMMGALWFLRRVPDNFVRERR
jgi:UMF1 family MFS transporter